MSRRICILALAVLIIMGLFVSDKQVLAGVYGINNLKDLQMQCQRFVQKSGPKIRPSQDCCEVVKGIDVQCACKLVSNTMHDKISTQKVAFVAQSCGITIPPGTKCGSF